MTCVWQQSHFEVHTFSPELDRAAHHLDVGVPTNLNSAVLVAYLGASFCACCILELPHGAKQCASILHFHQDRGGSANSQAASTNHTINILDSRMLSMELRQLNPADKKLYTDQTADRVEFQMRSGTEFRLEPQDEQLLPRLDGAGQVNMGSYFHGMVTCVADDAVSGGFVFRNVVNARDVDVGTNLVIMTAHERVKHENHVITYDHPPTWAGQHARDTRANATQLAREHWHGHAPQYVRAIKPLMERAFQRWGVELPVPA